MSRVIAALAIATCRPWSILAAAIGYLLVSTTICFPQEQLNPQQQLVLRTTMNAEGWLTADQHRQFWAPVLPKLGNPEVLAAWRRTMDRVVGLSMKFQLETWRSMQLSQRDGHVAKTPDYDEAKRAVLADAVVGPQSSRGIDNAERMFEAAASKVPFNTPNGPIYVSEDMIEKVLSGLEGSFCRVRHLTDPQWKPNETEYKYPVAHVKILAQCPLVVEHTDLTTEQGLTTKAVVLSYVVSEQERIGITFTPIRGRWIDPVGSLARVAQSSLKGMGITEIQQPLVTTWRGRQTTTASGSVKLSQGSVNAAVRVVEGADVQGSWALLAISSQSLPEAQALLAAVEERIVLE